MPACANRHGCAVWRHEVQCNLAMYTESLPPRPFPYSAISGRNPVRDATAYLPVAVSFVVSSIFTCALEGQVQCCKASHQSRSNATMRSSTRQFIIVVAAPTGQLLMLEA